MSLVFLLRFSGFSWINCLQSVASLWLFSSVLKMLILIILPVISWLLWRIGFMDVLILLFQKSCLPFPPTTWVVSFYFIFWLFHSSGMKWPWCSIFFSPINSDQNSCVTLPKYSVCTKMITIPWNKKDDIHSHLGLRGLLFSMPKNVRVINIPNILDTIQQYQVKQKEFKTNTGGRESNIYWASSMCHFIRKILS